MPNFSIRLAQTNDIDGILELIGALADYEHLRHAMSATAEQIRNSLFSVQPEAYCILAFEDDEAVGFAFYFYNYSTFLGKKGLYLEDLFVKPDFRGKGYGKQLITYLMREAANSGCGRMEWSVLNWNTPAIEFYQSLGAEAMSEWTVYRLNEAQLQAYKSSTAAHE